MKKDEHDEADKDNNSDSSHEVFRDVNPELIDNASSDTSDDTPVEHFGESRS